MKIFSSHILDSVSGYDASGIHVVCYRIENEKNRSTVFDLFATEEGRISFEINTNHDAIKTRYEFVFFAGEYFQDQLSTDFTHPALSDIIIRLDLSRTKDHFHMPIVIAPHNYTVWWSN